MTPSDQDAPENRSTPNPSPPQNQSPSEDHQFPVWLRRTILICSMLSVAFLVTAFLYPSLQPDATRSSSLPAWKQKANEIITIALQNKRKKIPKLIEYLDSRNQHIQQNAEWALYYMTDMPWAEKTNACLEWWRNYGNIMKPGHEPPVPPPEHPTFNKRISPDEANLEFFFNLISPKRLVVSKDGALINYEVGLVNKNEDTTIRIFPPEKLPYRAYQFGPSLPKRLKKKYNVTASLSRIPVHLQYGPSVAFVSIEWFDPMKSLSSPYQSEFLEYTVLGRNQKTLKPNKILGKRKKFPIRWEQDLMSQGPHVVARLSLDGRDLLTGYQDQNVRVSFSTTTYILKIFKQDPQNVPGYSDQQLKTLRKNARRNGLKLQRAERMVIGGYTWNVSDDTVGVETANITQNGKPVTGNNSISNPRTYAAYLKDLQQDTIIYDPELGWGKIQNRCPSCRTAYRNNKLLSQMNAYLGRYESGEEAHTLIQKHSGRRWILVFTPQ